MEWNHGSTSLGGSVASRLGLASAVCFGIAAMLAVLLMTSEALADDHRRPSTALVAGSVRQKGRIVGMSWARRVSPSECIVTDGTNGTTFPHPLRYRTADQLSVRLRKDEMPVEYSVEAWRSVRRDGTPRGPSQLVPASMEPHMRDGQTVAWDLRFQSPYQLGHTYLMATAYWPDETNCWPPPDLGSQFASWTFHVKTQNP